MTTKAQLIVTYPGSAHFDEVAATSLVPAANDDKVFRIKQRQPTHAELEDPNVWLVDVGYRHEPEKRDLDHHQDTDCPATSILVAEYLGLSETMSVMPWWRLKDSVDRFGPVRISIEFHAGDDLVNRNPVETWLTDAFASAPDACLPMLKAFGASMIRNARMLKRQIDFWKTAPRLVIAGVPAVMGGTTESAGLEEFRRLEKDPLGIVISLDLRGKGWRLFRYDRTPVDFSRISECPEIAFAHKSGFLEKTRERLSKDDLIALASKAITSGDSAAESKRYGTT